MEYSRMFHKLVECCPTRELVVMQCAVLLEIITCNEPVLSISTVQQFAITYTTYTTYTRLYIIKHFKTFPPFVQLFLLTFIFLIEFIISLTLLKEMTTENTFSFFEVQIRLVVTKFDAMYHGICSVNILVKHYFFIIF